MLARHPFPYTLLATGMDETFYIRAPEEQTARGPYNIDQLATLAEAGKIKADYFYFDETMETWVRIESNQALFAQIYPEKKKLVLRSRDEEDDSEEEDDNEPDADIGVDQLLAAAEGQTEETRHVRVAAQWRARTAALVSPVLAILLLVSSLAVLYPSWTIIEAFLNNDDNALAQLLQQPIVFLGGLDLIMAILLLLNATEIFPLIRLRAMAGAGFFGVLYAANGLNGDPLGLWMALAAVAFGLGLFVCTLTLTFRHFVAAATTAAAGALGLASCTNLVPLLFGG